MVDGMEPIGADIFHWTAHTNCVDLRGGSQGTDDDRNVVVSAVRINNVGEQKGSTIILVDAAKKLAADQRVQFRVLIDRVVDANKQAIRFQFCEMGLKIQARLFRGWWLHIAHAAMILTLGYTQIKGAPSLKRALHRWPCLLCANNKVSP